VIRPEKHLNHVELLYRPGERELSQHFLSLLGLRPVDRGGTWYTALIEPDLADFANNTLYASEMTAEQQALERALAGAMEQVHELRVASDAYEARLRREPQRSAHFGIRYPTLELLEEAADRVAAAGRDDPRLAGRVGVSGIFRPGDPGAATDTMVQAFVRNDIIAAGLLTHGQHIELQWQLPSS
jgi:hypothetical protein